MWKKFYRWLDDRTNINSLIRRVNDEPIRGGARWSYVFGSLVLLLLLVQAFTGIFLTLYYVPSSDHAHASVSFIQKVVAGGGFIRGLHYYGASALILLVLAHFIQTFFFGAYKGKRELLWISGLVLFLLILAFAFTGYLLPWTQEAYFGTRVGTSIMGEVPVVGPLTERIVLGGNEMTTLTLSRFFTLHVFLLPLGLGLFAALHLLLFRKAGPAGPFHHRQDNRVELFYPKQAFLDAVFFFLLSAVLLVLVVKIPASLGPEADPTSNYLARPPWYFLPLFQLLKYFPGNLTLVPTVVLPGIVFVALAVLPFFDKKEERNPAYRPVAMLLLLLGLLGGGGLLALAKYQDRANPELRATFDRQRLEEKAYLKTPFQPQEIGRTIPIQPPTVIAMGNIRDPILKIYFANCANCHGADATGGGLGPSLVRLATSHHLSQDFLIRFIAGHAREPSPDSMPRYSQLNHQEQTSLAEWLLRLQSPQQLMGPRETAKTILPVRPAAKVRKPSGKIAEAPPPGIPAPEPPEAFKRTCAFCHGADAQGNIGPSLVSVTSKPSRSPDDLLKLLDDSRSYGLKDPMPPSFPKLTPDDKKAIVDWLAGLK